ncbi:MAG: hypothetical protein C5B59_18630 [Bacteroidetes bacterium]|nr:MAG: hypothetical protein C5B59_18630 [Bacteroidota bacterium]
MLKPTLLFICSWFLILSGIAQQSQTVGNPISDPNQPIAWPEAKRVEIQRATEEFIKLQLSQKPKLSITSSTTKSKILAGGCTVHASFTPGNDTVWSGSPISFTNTSQNADSYEWLVDVYNQYTSPDLLNFVPSVGVTPVMLVAHQGNCTDTALTYVIRNGIPPTDIKRTHVTYGLPNSNEWVSCMAADKTDGYLLAGVSGDYDQNGNNSPYFVRVSETGCILWSILLPRQPKCFISKVLATYDGGFIAQVVLTYNIDKSYLLKLDKNGNILWTRSYTGTNPLNVVTNIKELSDHSLMVMSGPWSGKNLLLTSLTETGTFLWQKLYLFNNDDYGRFTDLVEQSGFLYLSASYYQLLDANLNKWNQFPMLFKVDATNGNLQWWKGYSSPNKYYTSSGINFYKGGLILNGFADSMINVASNKWSNYQSLLETDLDGNLRNAKLIMNPYELDAQIGNNVFVDENNNLEIFFSGSEVLDLQPYISYQSYYMRLDANKNILWQRLYTGYTNQQLVQAVQSPQKGMAMIGQGLNSTLNPFYGFSENLLMIKVDSNGKGTDLFCGEFDSYSTVQDLPVVPYSPGTPVVTNSILQVMDQQVNGFNPNSELRYLCPDYVPTCSFLKLAGKNFVCNLKDTLEFVAHKDPTCADPVTWTYDLNNTKMTFQDGNRLRLLFKTPGKYTVLATKPFPCTNMHDSIVVTVAPTLLNFYLGNDTTLCSGDSLVLRPVGKYDQYLWQDGSILDSFKVKTAGEYHLMVTDSCGNTKADTIQVTYQSNIPIDLGPPRNICPTDKILINPPGQYASYDWEPKYNMMTPTTGDGVIVFPAIDTIYTLTVKNYAGCKGTGKLAFHIYPTQKPLLGNDTAICYGNHVFFTVNGGVFESFAWSDGETSRSIDIQSAGSYSVVATDYNQCQTSDTVSLTVYPLPSVHIAGETIICKDQKTILDAGMGFATYTWQDGSQSEQFMASDTGYYRVRVTDTHQCANADSVHITDFAQGPRNFLPDDTVICNYGEYLIQANGNFVLYTWNTGESTSSIKVKSAGMYTLQVEDGLGCHGTDSIIVTTKDCDALLSFPNAFTPNNDGINDVFRLRYPGRAQNYQLEIFNRWGQLMFRSSDPYAGWNGLYQNQPQPLGTYVWMVKFTDRNGKNQMMKGTVELIR